MILSKVKLLLLLQLLWIPWSSTFAQTIVWSTDPGVDPKLAKRLPDEISEAKAITLCEDLLKALRLPPLPDKIEIKRVKHVDSLWRITTPEYRFLLFGKTGHIYTFSNEAKRDELDDSNSRTGRCRFANRIETQVYANQLFDRLKLAKNLELSSIKEGSTIGDDLQTIQVTFSQTINGKSFYLNLGGVVIDLDPQDGCVIRFVNASPLVVVESSEVRLKESEAITIADKIAKANQFEKMPDQPWPPTFKLGNELKYVFRKGVFGAKPNNGSLSQKFRMAWIIKYPLGDTVWVDAVNGEILGGEYVPRPGLPSLGVGLK